METDGFNNSTVGRRGGIQPCLHEDNINHTDNYNFTYSNFSMPIAILFGRPRQRSDKSTLRSYLMNNFRTAPNSFLHFRILPILYASSNSSSAPTSSYNTHKNSHDALIEPHIALRNLHFDDEEVIERTNHLLANETGWDRLNQIFHTREPFHYSDDLSYIRNAFVYTGFFGLLFGAAVANRSFKEEFKYYNKLTKFDARIKAVRQMNDQVYVRSVIEGFRWAWRLSLFTGTFLSVSQGIAVYRNKSSAFEYGIGAAVTGSLFRFHMGLKAMLGAGVIAGAMGMVIGTVIYGLQRATGESQDRRHFKQVYKHELHEIRLKRLQEQPVT